MKQDRLKIEREKERKERRREERNYKVGGQMGYFYVDRRLRDSTNHHGYDDLNRIPPGWRSESGQSSQCMSMGHGLQIEEPKSWHLT
jgi:hypothetical protein